MVSKANQILYILKLTLSKSTISVKQAAYKSLVRPVLEYSSSVWDPYYANLINSVEMVQRKAARFCLSRYRKTDSVTDMLHILKWDSLTLRRKGSRLHAFSNIYHERQSPDVLKSYITKKEIGRLQSNHNLLILI